MSLPPGSGDTLDAAGTVRGRSLGGNDELDGHPQALETAQDRDGAGATAFDLGRHYSDR